MMKEKYSLVLEGGGAKGAYQIGAYMALKEKGFEFDHVVGTSIGAINGAVIAQGDVEKGIYFCPTIQFLNEWFKTYAPPYDPAVHDFYEGDTVAEKELNRVYDNLRKAAKKKIGLTIGSDSFCSSLTPYGITAIGEMVSFVEKAKISIMDTIVAATKTGAEMLKVDDVTGTLEKGKSADLLVLSKNPLENIRNISPDNMVLIVKEGEMIKNKL